MMLKSGAFFGHHDALVACGDECVRVNEASNDAYNKVSWNWPCGYGLSFRCCAEMAQLKSPLQPPRL